MRLIGGGGVRRARGKVGSSVAVLAGRARRELAAVVVHRGDTGGAVLARAAQAVERRLRHAAGKPHIHSIQATTRHHFKKA